MFYVALAFDTMSFDRKSRIGSYILISNQTKNY